MKLADLDTPYAAQVVVTGVDPDTLKLNGTDDFHRVTRDFTTREALDAWIQELDDRSVLVVVLAVIDR
jgi:hypothetical protein